MVDEAKKVLGDSISSVFVDCIRERLESRTKMLDPEGMQKLSVQVEAPSGAVLTKSFRGRWLIEEGETAEENWDAGCRFWVALGAKGGLVLFRTDQYGERGTLETFGDFDAFQAAELPQDIIAETAEALGRPYEIEFEI
jgi:hypothetical protein